MTDETLTRFESIGVRPASAHFHSRPHPIVSAPDAQGDHLGGKGLSGSKDQAGRPTGAPVRARRSHPAELRPSPSSPTFPRSGARRSAPRPRLNRPARRKFFLVTRRRSGGLQHIVLAHIIFGSAKPSVIGASMAAGGPSWNADQVHRSRPPTTRNHRLPKTHLSDGVISLNLKDPHRVMMDTAQGRGRPTTSSTRRAINWGPRPSAPLPAPYPQPRRDGAGRNLHFTNSNIREFKKTL